MSRDAADVESSRSRGKPRRADSRPNRPVLWNGRVRKLLVALTAMGGVYLLGTDPPWRGRRKEAPGAPTLRLDLNTAPTGALSALPGLGPKLSRQIEVARESRPFDSLDDLRRRVKGVGPSTLARVAPHLQVGPGETTAVATAGGR